jgi:protein-tyrosine phosphatase
MSSKKTKSPRKRTRKMSVSEFIRMHSPIKGGGLRVKDEDEPLASYNKVMNRIYLGNYQAAEDATFFKKKNIKAVLNCTRDLPNYFVKSGDIEYMRIPVEDSLKEYDYKRMYQLLPAAVEFIHKHAVTQGNNIFVGCIAGRQRSAACVAAYLMAKHKMTPHEACKLVMDKRPEAFHFGKSLNFDETLKKYYNDLKKCK